MKRPPTAGYTRAAKWVASLADGRTVFVKVGSDEEGRAAVEQEARLLGELDAPFLPVLHGWSAGEETVLVLEDLSSALWPPPYPADTMPLFDALSSAGRLAAPRWLRPLPQHEPAWQAIAVEPEPLLGLAICSPAWLARAVPELVAAENRADQRGDELVHFDVWSGNVCFAERGAVLVDWALARRGNASLDVAFALLSLRAEGGTRPPEVGLNDEAAWATYLAGSLAERAPLPLPDWAAPDSTLQEDLRGDLVHALRWAAEALGLPEPDGVSG